MNREQRRELKKKVKKNSFLRKAYEASKDWYDNILPPLNEGDKVKLNYERIISNPGYKTDTRPEYRNFIENNKNNIFTVEYDSIRKEFNSPNMKYLVQLEEDENMPKFLFSSGDLIIVERATVKEEKSELQQYIDKVEESFNLLLGEEGEKYV